MVFDTFKNKAGVSEDSGTDHQEMRAVRSAVKDFLATHGRSEQGLLGEAFHHPQLGFLLRQVEHSPELEQKIYHKAVEILDTALGSFEDPQSEHDYIDFQKFLCTCLIGSGSKGNAGIVYETCILPNLTGSEKSSPFDPVLQKALVPKIVEEEVLKIHHKTQDAISRMQAEMDGLLP